MKPRESDKPKMRKCLRCRVAFLSEWSGNRSCTQCLRRTPDYNRHVVVNDLTTNNHILSETGRRIMPAFSSS